jgi:hypothetical protein
MSESESSYSFDVKEIFVRIMKYFVEGLVVAAVAFLMPGKKLAATEIVMIGLVAAATFALLDLFAPSIGASARVGAGFGVGANLVGFPSMAQGVRL